MRQRARERPSAKVGLRCAAHQLSFFFFFNILKTKTKTKTNSIIGRVEGVKKQSAAALTASKKADRRNAARIEQSKKRAELVSTARLFTGSNAPPKIVVSMMTIWF